MKFWDERGCRAAKSSPKLALCDEKAITELTKLIKRSTFIVCCNLENVATQNVGQLPAHHHPISVTEQRHGDKLLLVRHRGLLG